MYFRVFMLFSEYRGVLPSVIPVSRAQMFIYVFLTYSSLVSQSLRQIRRVTWFLFFRTVASVIQSNHADIDSISKGPSLLVVYTTL